MLRSSVQSAVHHTVCGLGQDVLQVTFPGCYRSREGSDLVLCLRWVRGGRDREINLAAGETQYSDSDSNSNTQGVCQ